MTSGITSYGWNPMLSPSLSTWSTIESGVTNLANSGLSAQALTNINNAQTDSTLFGSNSISSIYDSLSISPNAYSLFYNADNTMSKTLGNGSVSPQTFFSEAQSYTNATAQTTDLSTTSLLSQFQSSQLQNTAPDYYLKTFNPYNYLGNGTSQSPSSLFDMLV